MSDTPKKVIILGGSGNGSVVAAAIQDANSRGYKEYEVAGYLNDRLDPGHDIEGKPVLGGLKDAIRFIEEGYYFINTIYRIDGQDRRIALFENMNIPESNLATFIHPLSYVAANVKVGPGCVIMPHASVSSGVKLGRCCLVMVNAVIGHNSRIDDYCHVAAQSCLGACNRVKKGVHLGLNASVRENLTLGEYSALGMGGVLLNDMGDFEIWTGVPAKLLRLAKKEL